MMRRTSLMLVLVVALAGCSSGSSDKADSSKSTSPKVAATSTSPKGAATSKPSPTSVKLVIVKATDFCTAFKQLGKVKAANGAKVAGAAYQSAAEDMRKFAPASIKDAANAYADVIESSGKALTSGGMPTAMTAKPSELAKVTVWVTKNCKK